jgi:hypothetical protein
MIDETLPTSQGRWMRLKSASKYVNLSPSAMAQKLAAGNGPKFYRSPGSRFRLFWTGDLDAWILSAPKHPVTQAERERLIKFQEGAERAREERRARRQAKIGEDVTA